MDSFKKLNALACQSIIQNIVTTPQGPFLMAGGHQFQSLWTRDFCWAAFGLLGTPHQPVVENHLQYLLNHLNNQGLAPRIFETGSSAKTVVLNTVFRFLPQGLKRVDFKNRSLKPEYLGEHKTPAVDSNALMILLSFQLEEISKNLNWLELNKDKILKAYEYYDCLQHQGLLEQPAYSDWQDSAERKGKTFYLNILYWQATRLLEEKGWVVGKSAPLAKKIWDIFYEESTGLFKTHENMDVVSLEGNLLACLWTFENKAEDIYHKLKQHPLWQSKTPGLCSFPNYDDEQISWTTRAVGLKHYHDDMCWSWLMGLSLKVARILGDKAEADRLLALVENYIERDGLVYEVYRPIDSLPFSNFLYESESPFSWGSGVFLWATH